MAMMVVVVVLVLVVVEQWKWVYTVKPRYRATFFTASYNGKSKYRIIENFSSQSFMGAN